MEPNDAYHPYRTHSHRRLRAHSGLVPGIILVVIGALFFLNNLHIVYWRDWFDYWPGILIAVGIIKLVDSTFTGGRIAGGILIGLGAVLLAQTLGFLPIAIRDMWPLLLIALGVLLLLQRMVAHGSENWRDARFSADTLNEVGIFGGGKRLVTSRNFQGGEVVAIFGGWEIDLREAAMTADSASIEINAIFGGAEVKIPRNWIADIQGVGIFGGYSNATVPPDGNGPEVKKLIVRGAAIFGGVEIKN